MMPQPGADPAQQKMTQFMPLIFGFMFYNFASGLVLYYLTSNLVGIAQQWFFNHTDTARALALSVEPPAKKKNGKKSPLPERKYSAASSGPRIDSFLRTTLQ